jgi:hypothetical protein
MPTSKFPQLSPSGLFETPEDGVGVNAAPHSDNPDGTVGLH